MRTAFSALVDKLDRELKRRGTPLKHAALFEIAAGLFGYASSNEALAAATAGEIIVPRAVGATSPIPLRQIEDPTTGRVFGIPIDMVGAARRADDIICTPWGTMVDIQEIGRSEKAYPSETVRERPRSHERLSLVRLGYTSDQINAIRRLIYKPTGMILLCGPSGSGMGWTKVALLEDRQDRYPETKTTIVEHSFHYGVRDASILHVKTGRDMKDRQAKFEETVRDAIRMNPHVVLIDEIGHDFELQMAEAVTRAGHLMISRVHAMDTFDGVADLHQIGGDRSTLCDPSLLVGMIAQRRIRTLCQTCSLPANNDDGLEGRLFAQLPRHWRASMRRANPEGCAACDPWGHSKGHAGLSLIAETVEPDEAMLEAVAGGDSKKAASLWSDRPGAYTMAEHALARVLRGEMEIGDVSARVDLKIRTTRHRVVEELASRRSM